MNIYNIGKNRDGWFTNKDLIEQFNDLKQLFQDVHEGKDIIIAFDNSMTHRKKAPDGLDITALNKSDGGKVDAAQARTRDGWYYNDKGTRVTQSMYHDNGVRKGLQTILLERRRILPGRDLLKQCRYCSAGMPSDERRDLLGTPECCLSGLLSIEPDFAQQKEWLREVVELAGFTIVFYPKYHCELNFIEQVWGWLKERCRQSCSYRFKDLQPLVTDLMDNQLLLGFVRKACRNSFRFMDGYVIGLTGTCLDYIVKKYKGHRVVPVRVIEALETDYLNEMQRKKNKRLKTEP